MASLLPASIPHPPRFSLFEQDDPAWISRFVGFVLDTIEEQVGFVKFQSAYFEACGIAGLTALSLGMKRAKAAGIGVILDAKRGDIGATAAAYARAYLTAVALTVDVARAVPSDRWMPFLGR